MLQFMKMILVLNLLFICKAKGSKMNNIKDVSMIQLIATPEKYDKQHIRVIGYLLLEFERTVIYLSSLDYENSISKNALQLKDLDLKKYSKENKSYVLIEGIFNFKTYGRRGLLYSGSIEKVNRLMKWEKEK